MSSVSSSSISRSHPASSRASDDDSEQAQEAPPREGLLIVAVHGLVGKDFPTWTPQKGSSLPSLLSEAVQRTSSDGVDPSTIVFQYAVKEGFMHTDSCAGIRKLALELLEEVYQSRTDTFVPIVFLAHDFGGILVKEALLLARLYTRYRSIAVDTDSLLLFATPQRSDDSSWSSLFLNILFGLPESLRDDLLKLSWAETVTAIEDVSRRFRAVAAEYMVLSIFQETNSSEDDGDSEIVVKETEATSKMPHEKTLGRKKDHFKICQFTAEDGQLKILVEQINEFRSAKPFDPYRNDYLQLLSILSPKFMAGYEIEWSTVTKSSFEWILKNETFQLWLASTSPAILHLHGVKGAGKTVISHFLVDTLKDREGCHGTSVASFFLRKNDDRCNTVQSLCMSLTAQLLVMNPSFFRYISDFCPTFSRLLEEPDLDEFCAWTLLRTILCCAERQGVICVINAIHEADSAMESFLTDLMEAKATVEAPFKIIVTSTSEVYRETLQPCHELSLDAEENMKDQVISSIKESVASLLERRPALKAFETEIITQICDAKPLNLLQAELGLKYIEEARIQSTPISLRSALAQLSESSAELALQNLIRASNPWVSGIFSWMTHAFRPLRLGELATAMAMKDLETSPDPIDDYLARDIEADLQQTLGSWVRVQKNEVQFVHPSIREAVQRYIETESTELSHREIALTCLAYISGPRLELAQRKLECFRTASETDLSDSDMFSKDYGLVLYAVQYWPAHYRSIDKPSEHDTRQVCRFLEQKDLVKIWSEIDRSTQRPVLNIPVDSIASPIHLAAYLGLEDVLKFQFDALHSIDAVSAELRQELLKIAAAKDRLEATQFLLECLPCTPADISCSLNEALSHRSKNVISVLIDHLDLRQEISDVDILLEKAASIGQDVLLRAILHSHLGQQFTPIQLVRCLCAAATVGNENAVVEVLNSNSLWQIENEDPVGECSLRPLHHAVLNGHEQIVKLVTQKFEQNHQQFNQRDERGRTPLHLACSLGFPKMVKLLTAGPVPFDYINATDHLGRTSLHYAAFHGHVKTVKALVSLKADLEAKTGRGRTALYVAVLEQRKTVVDQLLELRAVPDASDYHGETPLHAAVALGSLEMVELLVKHNAQVNEESSTRFTPLLLAVQRGSLDIFEFLRENGARLTTQDDEGLTPLHWASKNGHPDVVRRILELGADPNVADKSDLRPIHHAAERGSSCSLEYLVEKGADIESKTPREKTALHLAAEKGNRDSVALLLSRGANTNQTDWIGKTPLEIALDQDNLSTAALLLSSQNEDHHVDGSLLEKLLHRAALDEHLDLLKEVLKTNVDLGSKDSDGDSIIVNAVYGESIEVITTLLGTPGVDVNDAGTDNTGPLQVAVMKDRRDIVELLLSHGANINKSNGRTGTPLHAAVASANMGLLKLLLEKGAGVNEPGGNFETSLSTAVVNGNEEIIELLVKKGSDLKAVGGKWGNAVNAAVAAASTLGMKQCRKILELLFEHGASIQDEDQQGRSAIHMTGCSGSLEMLKMCMSLDDDQASTRKDKQGRTTLHFAAARGREDMVAHILGPEDVDVSQWLDGDKWTPLHWACRNDNQDVLQLLLQKGFDATAKASNGWSAIHVAIFHENQEALYLLEAQCDKPSNMGSENERERESESESESENKRQNESDDESQDEEPPKPLFSPEGLPLRGASSIYYSCDGCYCQIFGPIYHCRECVNYDFCFKCAWTRDVTHPDHHFEVIRFKDEVPP